MRSTSRLLAFLVAIALVAGSAMSRAEPVPLEMNARVGAGTLFLQSYERVREKLGEAPAEGEIFVVLRGAYARDDTAAPLELDAAQDAFRLELRDGSLRAPDPLSQDVVDSWWGPLTIGPAEAVMFELVFAVPETAVPARFVATLEGESVRLAVGPPAASAAETGRAAEAPAGQPASPSVPERGSGLGPAGPGEATVAEAAASGSRPATAPAPAYPDEVPQLPPFRPELHNILPLAPVVASIEAADGHEALRDGKVGPDAPVTRAGLDQPVTIRFRRPWSVERLRLVLRTPEAGGYFLRIEGTPDGQEWRILAEQGQESAGGAVDLLLARLPLRGLRITALSGSPGVEALEIEELELWSRDHVPMLRHDIAWAGHGGRVIAARPPSGDDDRPPFHLIDGDSSSWWGGKPGAQKAELVFGFLEDRAFAIDAVQLLLDTDEGIPTRIEILTSIEGPDRGFESAGTFEVPMEEKPLFVFPPRAARYVMLRLEEPRGSDRIWVSGVRIFEAEVAGYEPRLPRLIATASDAPDPRRNIALIANGGTVLAHPELVKGTAGELHDGRVDWQSVQFDVEEARFLFGFFGRKRARIGEVRLHLEDIDWPGRVRIEIADREEGPFTPVAERLLPPADEAWRRIAFEPAVARFVRVVVIPDPRDGGAEGVDEIAIIEEPSTEVPSVLEVPPQETVPLGANLALAVLGGEIVRVSAEEQQEGWSARRLIDGLVAGPYYGTHGSLGFTTPENPTWPVEIDLRLAGGRPARVIGVGLDPSFKYLEGGILDTDFRGDAANRPHRFEIEASEDGSNWHKVHEGELRNRPLRQTFRFDEPVSARFLRFRFLDNYGGNRLQLGEIEVYEDPSLDTTRSVLADREINIARPELGGAVVDYSSQYHDGEGYVGHLFDGEPGSVWGADSGWTWPQKFLLAFAGNAVAEIAAVELVPRDADQRPRVVKIRATRSENPLADLELVGRFEAPADEPVWRITFDRPIAARYLEVSMVEGFNPRYLTLGELRVIEAKRPGYRSVLARALDSFRAERGGGVEARAEEGFEAAVQEREPNDEPAAAQIVEAGRSVAGTIAPLGERDHYLLGLSGTEPAPYRFLLEGRPLLKTRLEIEDKGGRALFAFAPDRSRARFEGTMRLAPGTYLLRLFEPRTRIVVVVDVSGSMRSSMPDARAAVERFLAGMTEQEEVALVTFSSTVNRVRDFTADRDALRRSAAAQLNAEGGTALYDAMLEAIDLLADHPGNRAIVLLSDGADSQSGKGEAGTVFDRLTRAGIRFYAIALGEGMSRYVDSVGTTPARMLDFWARATGGRMLATPSSAGLERLYARIARDLRTGTRYRFSFMPEAGSGRLVLRQTGERIAGVGTPDKILFILDASGSMRGKDADGVRKMNTAKTVLKRLVRTLPDDIRIGLRVYGHRYPRKPKRRSCTDSELVVPFARVDKERFAAFVDSLQPRGQTPIGLSLRKVAEDFGDAPGRKIVVLITDGEETCSPKPADPDYPPAVIEKLLAAGLDIRVNIVGFDIDKTEVREFLADLAARTGGGFYTADSAAGLEAALEQALKAPYEVKDLLGTTIARGTIDGGAIELPAGIYRVEVAAVEPLVIEDVRIEAGRETVLDINREGREIAIDRRIGEPRTPLATERPQPGAESKVLARAEEEPRSKKPAGKAEPGRSGREKRDAVALLLEEAEQLFREKKLTTPEKDSALSRYRAVLALDPDNERARAGIERIVETYVRWAESAEKRGDFEKALAYYGRALVADPDNFALRMVRALTYLQLDRPNEALADLLRATRISPEHPAASFHLGLTYLQLGRPADAVEPLRRAYANPDFGEREAAGYLLALALAGQERFKEAFDQLTAVLRQKGDCESAPLDQLCTDLWVLAVRVLEGLERDDVVMETVRGVLDLKPASPELHDAIARVFRENGREEEARRIEAQRAELFGR